MLKVLSIISLLVPLSTAAATFTSGPKQTALIELYTSEGCSSCPPAEQRMNDMADRSGLWTDFVPVAFHVDYWNYIGWHDPFSKPEFTARQRAYSKEWRARTIYTPCFVENGKTARSPNLKARTESPGTLSVTADNGTARISFVPAGFSGDKLTAWVAPLSGDEHTNVTRGENRGRTLDHRFVALGLESTTMKRNDGSFTAELPADQNAKAVAVWLSSGKSLKPIQAAGGWLK
jgi:hypothetical protein